LETGVAALRGSLGESGEKLESPMTLTFKGTGHFRQRVVFIKPGEESINKLKRIESTLRPHFEEYLLQGDKEFTPHVTIAKTSQLKGAHKWKLRISEELYESYRDIEVDGVEIDSVQLCQMGGRKKDSYYEVVAEYLI